MERTHSQNVTTDMLLPRTHRNQALNTCVLRHGVAHRVTQGARQVEDCLGATDARQR